MKKISVFVLSFAFSSLTFAQTSVDQKKLETQVAALPAEKMQVIQPHEKKSVHFTGVNLTTLLDKLFGPAWRNAETAIFVCSDGYKAPVPVQRILQHKAWFAFRRDDRSTFTITESVPTPHDVSLAPYALVWDSENDEESKKLGAEGWPWQVVGIELVSLAEQYPKLQLPASASLQAKRGWEVYKHYCLNCHAIDGEGGQVGPELGVPVNVTTYFNLKYLRKWLVDPQSVRKGAKMPPAIPAGPEQARQIDDVIAYLKAQQLRK